jgi:hypothetical protein
MAERNNLQRHTRRAAALLATTGFVLAAAIQAAQETIPQAVARGATGRITTAPSGKPPDMDDILRDVDVVVRGVVGEPRSFLSEDKRDVYTEYSMKRPIVAYQARPVAAAVPGVGPEVSVTQLGGTVMVDGVKFTQTEQGLPPLQPGTEALFLLKRIDGRYHIAGTFFGAFGIVAERLKPLTTVESFAPEYRDAPAREGTEKIVRRIGALWAPRH